MQGMSDVITYHCSLHNVHRSYAVFVMILRLRQVCSHPALMQNNGSAYVNPNEELSIVNQHAERRRAGEVVGPQFVKDVREKCLQIALKRANHGTDVRSWFLIMICSLKLLSGCYRRSERRRFRLSHLYGSVRGSNCHRVRARLL